MRSRLRTPITTPVLACGIFLACSNDDASSQREGGDPGKEGSSGGTESQETGDGDTEVARGGHAGGAGDGDADSTSNRPPVAADCEGLQLCGPDGETDCCQKVEVAGGTFPMGRGDDDPCPSGETCAPHETPENDVQVDTFFMDVFEVTVGRFRRFVEAYDSFSISALDGAHPLITASGWQQEFEALLPENEQTLRSTLNCDEQTSWTDSPGSEEAHPMNCVNWGVAFAFCVSEGGRLPTEAEWEYAAAGGDDNRLYPWGAQPPSEARASFSPAALAPAGRLAGGRGRYDTFDQAGNLWEWALDWLDTGWYEDQGMMCDNCARVSSGTHRVLRGGAYSYEPVTLRAATRSGELPETRAPAIGFRCAYSKE